MISTIESCEGYNMPTIITICETCKREGWADRRVSETDGLKFAKLIEQIPTNNRRVSIRRHSCLMGCKNGCNVIIQDNDKLSYALGNFTPDLESATALVNYANLHAESANGQVPYKSWPEKIKGHFVARIPPLRKD